MGKQEAHGLAVVSSAASLGERGTDINGLNLVTELLLLLMRDSIGHDNALQAAVVHIVNGFARKDTMDNNCIDFLCAVLHHCVGGLDKCSACIGHIINNDGNFIFHAADEDHAGDFVGTGAFLMDKGELKIKSIGDCSRSGLK